MYFNISRIEKKEKYINIYLDFGRYEKNKLYTKSSFFDRELEPILYLLESLSTNVEDYIKVYQGNGKMNNKNTFKIIENGR